MGMRANHIFKYDKTGKYLACISEKSGNGLQTVQYRAWHDAWIPDMILLACSSVTEITNRKGRSVTLRAWHGEFIEEVVTGLGMPTSVAVQGDYVSVPDLTREAW